MFNLLASLVINAAIASAPAATVPACEVVGPRLDGVSVEICDGTVVSYTDAQGNKLVPRDWR
jgi:hypothetical protein